VDQKASLGFAIGAWITRLEELYLVLNIYLRNFALYDKPRGLVMLFLDYIVFLEIFQKLPGGPSKTSSDSC